MASQDETIFRKEALKDAYSPEELDQLVNLTNPRAWSVLLSIMLLLATLLAWSIYGEISTRMSAPCIILTNANSLAAYTFIPPQVAKLVNAGMSVNIALDQADPDQYGYVVGAVSSITTYPQTNQDLLGVLRNNQDLVKMMQQQGPPFTAVVSLEPLAHSPLQYQWTKQSSNSEVISPGSLCTANILLSKQAPITLVIPVLATWLRK